MQESLVAVVVLGALAYLWMRWRNEARRKGGGCGSCPKAAHGPKPRATSAPSD